MDPAIDDIFVWEGIPVLVEKSNFLEEANHKAQLCLENLRVTSCFEQASDFEKNDGLKNLADCLVYALVTRIFTEIAKELKENPSFDYLPLAKKHMEEAISKYGLPKPGASLPSIAANYFFVRNWKSNKPKPGMQKTYGFSSPSSRTRSPSSRTPSPSWKKRSPNARSTKNPPSPKNRQQQGVKEKQTNDRDNIGQKVRGIIRQIPLQVFTALLRLCGDLADYQTPNMIRLWLCSMLEHKLTKQLHFTERLSERELIKESGVLNCVKKEMGEKRREPGNREKERIFFWDSRLKILEGSTFLLVFFLFFPFCSLINSQVSSNILETIAS